METKLKIHYILAMIFLFLFSVSFLLMPFSNLSDGTSDRVMLICVGAMFWISFLFGYWNMIMSFLNYKRLYRKESLQFVCFFTNVPTAIADAGFVGGILLFLLMMLMHQTNQYLPFICIAVITASFHGHLLFCNDLQEKLFH